MIAQVRSRSQVLQTVPRPHETAVSTHAVVVSLILDYMFRDGVRLDTRTLLPL